MKIPRFFLNQGLRIQDEIELDLELSHRLSSVLRLEKGASLILFNNDFFEYSAIITNITRKKVTIQILERHEKNVESPLQIHLGQVISKGEKMDFVIQKSTELGVHRITPLFSERSVVHLKQDRLDKKAEHWQKVAMSAAEQCGRTLVPLVDTPKDLAEWVAEQKEKTCLVLDPNSRHPLAKTEVLSPLAVLIGPEGGLTNDEVQRAVIHGFKAVKLGPRILRTETAALALLAAIQAKAGDL